MKSDAWMRGYATAMANIHRNFHDSSAVRKTIVSDGFSIETFKRIGVEEYDLKELRRAMGAK